MASGADNPIQEPNNPLNVNDTHLKNVLQENQQSRIDESVSEMDFETWLLKMGHEDLIPRLQEE